jgi:hypothetical protein
MGRMSKGPSDVSLLSSNSVSKSSGWQLVECGGWWEFYDSADRNISCRRKRLRSASSALPFHSSVFQLLSFVFLWMFGLCCQSQETNNFVCVYARHLSTQMLHRILIDWHIFYYARQLMFSLKFIPNWRRQSRVCCVLLKLGNIYIVCVVCAKLALLSLSVFGKALTRCRIVICVFRLVLFFFRNSFVNSCQILVPL